MGTICILLLLVLMLFEMVMLQTAAHHTHRGSKDKHSTSSEHSKKETTSKSNDTSPVDFEIPDHIIVALDNIFFSLDVYTSVQLTNLQLSVPSDLHIEDIDPDFSKMVLIINSTIGSLELKGDYRIFVNDYMSLPRSSQGYFYINFQNVSATGGTALALTPAAFLALNYNFKYTPEVITAEIDPIFQDALTEEARLSGEILKEPVITAISKQVDNQLNYFVETSINLMLGKISVFTVGHKKLEAFIKGPENQKVQIGELFDELLLDVRRVVIENAKDTISIPSFHRNFSEKLESAFINGTFLAEEGWVSGLSTLKRSSNVSLSKKEHFFVLSANIEFDDLEMGYDKYEAKFLKAAVNGKLEGTFLHRTMVLKISMHPKEDGTCSSSLNELAVYRMNGYRIKNITNIGSLDWLERRINNWLVGYFQIRLVKSIETELKSAVHRSLSRFDCGEYLPHLEVL